MAVNTGKPFLTTGRYDLWQPGPGDLEGLVRLLEGKDMTRFLGPARADYFSQFERLSRNTGSWALYGYGTFYVRKRGEAELIANCGIFHSWRGFGKGMDDVPEAGWIVRQDHWGEGLAGEVMGTVLPWFDRVHGRRRIACMIEEGNTPSERLATRLGFKHYGQHEAEDGKTILNLFERLPE
ncbi:GNAT family N-acetyltransferase [Novosphingobium sp. KN65.2]|uniref:GNAT family N-acetyltransferase n=1 Tax=Novosphingobium sp. KN65.2 TaxID=1478134 RepID=UPI0005E53B71|nr:GNAT family protein [Novosphingobium sp. KN65.2]CDO35114.1 GCN5-related N-acetyltransferase [Novosphingobium sp. KN65.2]